MAGSKMTDRKPAPEWAIERTVRISTAFRAHMTAGPGGFTYEWEPSAPKHLTEAQLNRYRRERWDGRAIAPSDAILRKC
jgi:hypothetical protein